MPLPSHDDACVNLAVTPQGIKVSLPGGVELAPNLPFSDFPGPLDVAKGLLAQINTALAPLTPIFNLIDVGIAVFKFAKSVPSLNPVSIANNTVNLAKAVDKLLRLIPQLSVPIMILDTIDAILAMLAGMVEELETLVIQAERIATAKARATSLGNAEMTAVLDCATGNLTAQMQSLNEGLAPLNRLVSLLNLIIGLVPGLPEIPTFENFSEDASAALEELATTIETLQNIRALIPVS